MQETTIIESKGKVSGTLLGTLTLISSIVISFLILLFHSLATFDSTYRYHYTDFWTGEVHYATGFRSWTMECIIDSLEELWFIVIPLLIFGIVLSIVFMGFKYQITVTDKRVRGIGLFGKSIDLPLDSISAVSTTPFLYGISVSTSSGLIKFYLIANSKEIHSVITELIINRQ